MANPNDRDLAWAKRKVRELVLRLARELRRRG